MIRILAHPLPPPMSKLSLSFSLRVSPVELTDGREGGEGLACGQNYAPEKVLPSLDHSILSSPSLQVKASKDSSKKKIMIFRWPFLF
jgi:hypothetical protein